MTADSMSSNMCSTESLDGRRNLLNSQTPNVTHCAWPDCGRFIGPIPHLNGQLLTGNRVGILCIRCARRVADATFASDVQAARISQWWGSMPQEPVDFRGVDQLRQERNQAAELQAKRADKPGFVYYIQIGDRLKIGFSVDVRRRMRAYPPESKLLAAEPGDKDLERSRHRQFRASLTHGREWFTMTSDLREHIDAVLLEHGEPPRHMAHHYGTKRQPMRLSRRP